MFEHFIGLLLIGLGIRTPVLPPSVLGDQDSISPTPIVEQSGEIKTDTQNIRSDRQQFGQDIKSEKGKLLQDRKQLIDDKNARKADLKTEMEDGTIASRPGMMQERKNIQDQFKSQIQDLRAKAKADFQSQHDAFKARLENIKDTKKKEIVSNADTKLSDINTKRTETMTNNLNKMDEILTKITTKKDELKAEGKDVSAIESALSDAQSKISAAKTSVSAQAGKEYVIGITSENKLKDDVGRSIKSLQSDFQTIQGIMQNARESVTNALKQLALVVGKTPEVSPQPTEAVQQ